MAGDSEMTTTLTTTTATTTTTLTTTTTASTPEETFSTASLGIILFYKYHPLSDDPSVVELYRGALERFCDALSLKGRILVGCSKHRSEGINGTLSGTRSNLEVFVRAFTEPRATEEIVTPASVGQRERALALALALATFRTDCLAFYRAADCPPVEMSESEFKWSEVDDAGSGAAQNNPKTTEALFPDLNIKIVKELIGTGGVLSSIPIDELHKGYLTPQEWHERLSKRATQTKDNDKDDNNNNNCESDTILIDCRNTKECAIGNFEGAIDPQTTTFNQFPKWVDDHKHKLRNKSVLMYCTGGIRCEKASAYVRQAMGSSVKEVRHLQGGIHKYLEAFGNAAEAAAAAKESDPQPSSTSLSSSLWRGKNFVFDGRGAHGPASEVAALATATTTATATATTAHDDQTSLPSAATATVGACRYCKAPYDSFDPHCVCTVCKEPILVCPRCQHQPHAASEQQERRQQQQQQQQHQCRRREYHCEAHRHLEDCYFTNLEGFSSEELSRQLEQLQLLAKEIAVGKKFKQRRKTLMKQCAKLRDRLEAEGEGDHARSEVNANMEWKCRNCGQVGCSGKCWGFHGLKRKRILEQEEEAKQKQQQQQQTNAHDSSLSKTIPPTKRSNKNNHNELLKERKELQKRKQIEDWIASGLTLGPSAGRDPKTGLRVPKPCVRVLETTTKGKWCGNSLLAVLRTEFPNSFRPQEPSPPACDSETELDDILRILFEKRLIRVNGKPVPSMDDANSYKLKNMDVIDRIVDWHEPPIHLPNERINVQRIPIPKECFNDADDEITGDDYNLYVCNKPSTVPVHPAGPYLSNSLTIMMEAQEGLPPKTLIPCHRIDRVTSGMTICCANPRVARLVQTTLADRSCLRKEYLAKVAGRFPVNDADDSVSSLPSPSEEKDLARWKWITKETTQTDGNDSASAMGMTFLQVDAPVETVDPLNGIRRITPNGKASTSLFRLLSYDAQNDTSILSCVLVTGRSHQLRVHLEWLGHSIVDDVQYGGSNTGSHEPGSFAIDPLAGVQRLRDNLDADSSPTAPAAHLSSSGVTEAQALAAREVCPIRNPGKGPAATFNPSQLLQGGHAICLHAYRYALTLRSTTSTVPRKNFKGEAPSRVTVHMKVDLPPWASHLASEEL